MPRKKEWGPAFRSPSVAGRRPVKRPNQKTQRPPFRASPPRLGDVVGLRLHLRSPGARAPRGTLHGAALALPGPKLIGRRAW